MWDWQGLGEGLPFISSPHVLLLGSQPWPVEGVSSAPVIVRCGVGMAGTP